MMMSDAFFARSFRATNSAFSAPFQRYRLLTPPGCFTFSQAVERCRQLPMIFSA